MNEGINEPVVETAFEYLRITWFIAGHDFDIRWNLLQRRVNFHHSIRSCNGSIRGLNRLLRVQSAYSETWYAQNPVVNVLRLRPRQYHFWLDRLVKSHRLGQPAASTPCPLPADRCRPECRQAQRSNLTSSRQPPIGSGNHSVAVPWVQGHPWKNIYMVIGFVVAETPAVNNAPSPCHRLPLHY